MTDTEILLSTDQARRQAMIDADISVLQTVLADDLTWTHSSGKTEDKAQVLQAIASGTVRYLALNIEDAQVRRAGDVFVHTGLLKGRAMRDGIEKELVSRFLSVWRRTEAGAQMMAWQSTNC